MAVKKAKLFANGRSQAVRLPKEFRFAGAEVYIERRGDAVILTPADADDRWARFHSAVGAVPDFPAERVQGTAERRKPLR
ncbi:MAG: antitoxin [Gemmatimonadaceae bacterium]